MRSDIKLSNPAFNALLGGLGAKATDYEFGVTEDHLLYINPKRRALDLPGLDRPLQQQLFVTGLWSAVAFTNGNESYDHGVIASGELSNIMSCPLSVKNDQETLVRYSPDGNTPLEQ